MNITLLGHYDIASLFALDRVIQALPEHRHSVRLSGVAGAAPQVAGPLAELHQADRILCREFLAGQLVGPVATALVDGSSAALEAPNSEQGLAELAKLGPDLIISIRYRRILHEAAIAQPRSGVLNLHSGILPDYRGVMATFWALLNGEAEIGTTLHWIDDPGIDTGPVIGIFRRPARPRCSYLGNVLGLYAGGCDLVIDAVQKVAAGDELPTKRQAGHGRYFRAPDGAAVAEFERAGLRLVDGKEGAEIRAAM